MIWSIIGLIGGGTLLVNGFSVLADPNCETVSFGGGRVVQATCYPAGLSMSGDFSGTLAGIGMLAVGVLILTFAWRNLKRR